MISEEVAMAEARAAIGVANLRVDAALGVLEDVWETRGFKSIEVEVATVAKFLMMTGGGDDAVVAAAVALVRLAGRDTVLR